MLTQTNSSEPETASQKMPRPLRFLLIGILTYALGLALYLTAVRAEAMYLDLGTLLATCF